MDGWQLANLWADILRERANERMRRGEWVQLSTSVALFRLFVRPMMTKKPA